MTDVSPEVQAVETIGGVITDLVTLAERLSVAPDQVEPVARILGSPAAGPPSGPDGDRRHTS